MKRVLFLGLLYYFAVSACFGSGIEGQDVSSIGDVRESDILSSLLPDSQGSSYLLAFPVDDNGSNDQPETVHAGGGGTSEIATEKPSSLDKEEKEEVMTVVLSAGDPKDGEKEEVVIPIQDIQPKEEAKFFTPPPLPIFPFRNKPTYQERKLPFLSPFDKFRPPFLPPMRNLLQTLRREQPSNNKISPISFLNAASLLKRALGNKLRFLNDRYHSPMMEEKLVPFPVFMPAPEPHLPFSHSASVPMFMPLPPPPEAMLTPPHSPLYPMFMLDSPPLFPPPSLPVHPPFLLPQSMHPFPIAPTPFMLPPPPPAFFYHSLPPKRMLHLPPPMPLYHPLPFPPHRLPSLPLHLSPPPPLFMQHTALPQMHMSEPVNVPLSEPPFMLQNIQELPLPIQRGSEEDEVLLIPSDGQFTHPEEPTYLLLYPNESELPQNELISKKRSLLDLLRPRPKVQHVIQQTRIITQYKPNLLGLLNQMEPPSYHKPMLRIMD